MALEFVGSPLLSAFLQVAFDRLASRQVLDFFRGRKLDETLLSMLKIKLLSIDALADEAERKQFRDRRVKAWLAAVKDAVLDAEDVLEEIHYELSKSEVEADSESQTYTGCSYKVPNFLNASFSSFNRKIDSRMRDVLKNLEFLASQRGDLGLKKASGVGVGSGSSSEVSQKLPSTSLVVDSVIYGRDVDKEKILNWLTSDADNCNQLSILSIVGMGGVGKTTLAQHVYNDPMMEEAKFDIKVWVCVSDDFDVFKITRKILEAITESTDDSRDLEMIHKRLKEKLTGKKFLLVLDDVWNENQEKWEAVQAPLINCAAQGSRILVTTRSGKVASAMWSKEHHLKKLREDHCWQLFAKHAFKDGIPQSNPGCKEIGMKIVEKCKGLPLALKTMGSLLRNRSSVSEWESVLKSEIWEFSEEDNHIVPALALSYHHLPSHLKICFAYCALFPKDYEFDKELLIQLWMAENFLQHPQQSKSLEEVGEQYFNDLLSRSFFQQSSNNKTYFVMHDLFNDLAKYVCGDMCFRLEADESKSIPTTTRHFSFGTYHIRYYDGFRSLYNAERLRTFMPTGWRMRSFAFGLDDKMPINDLFSKFKFLRVLSLSHCSELTKVPDSVGHLKYLRSLNLSHTGIKKLPDSTCSLSSLQILKLSYCRKLEILPTNLHKLTNLHRLEIIETRMRKLPAHMGKMKNLQVLMSPFLVGKSREFSIQRLEELNLHGRLSIGKLQNVENPSDALAVDLKNKAHLVELDLKWDLDQNPDDSTKERDVIVLENLEPPKHLEKLSIKNYCGTQFPSWLLNSSLSNVVSLELDNCRQCCHGFPPLGLLPFLKDLTISKLNGIVDIDADFYGNNSSSFTSLETLKFKCMEEWEKWECQAVTGAFPRLQHLSIVQCPKLKGHLPEQLIHLKELHISGCKQLLGDFGILLYNGKEITIKVHNMEAWLHEWIGHIMSYTSPKYLEVHPRQNINILTSSIHDFLVSLTITCGCGSLTTFALDFFPTLSLLDLAWCHNLQMISQEHVHNHLEDLRIRKCPQLESLPKRMHILLPSLTRLEIEDCPKVESFSDKGLPSNLNWMQLNKCSKFVASLEGAFGDNPSLEKLYIENVDVESFPNEGLLPSSLTSLLIYHCQGLKRLDNKGLCHLSSLKNLTLIDCPSLQCLPEGLCHLSSLKKLTLSDCRSLQCLPEDLCHLSSLKELVLISCPRLQCLPEDLCRLSSLRELVLISCPRLQCLPEEGLPKSISTLKISGCQLLEMRCQKCRLLKMCCQKSGGEDWGKIAHIENLCVAGKWKVGPMFLSI